MSRAELFNFIRRENMRSSSIFGYEDIVKTNEKYIKGTHHGFIEIEVINHYDKKKNDRDCLVLVINHDELIRQVDNLIKTLPDNTPVFIHVSKVFSQQIIVLLEDHVKQLFKHVFFLY